MFKGDETSVKGYNNRLTVDSVCDLNIINLLSFFDKIHSTNSCNLLGFVKFWEYSRWKHSMGINGNIMEIGNRGYLLRLYLLRHIEIETNLFTISLADIIVNPSNRNERINNLVELNCN